jgi:hypothetical protein
MSRPVILVGRWPRRMRAELAAYGEPAGDSPVGLSTPAPAAVADPHGCELLHSIRELARSEVDWLGTGVPGSLQRHRARAGGCSRGYSGEHPPCDRNIDRRDFGGCGSCAPLRRSAVAPVRKGVIYGCARAVRDPPGSAPRSVA